MFRKNTAHYTLHTCLLLLVSLVILLIRSDVLQLEIINRVGSPWIGHNITHDISSNTSATGINLVESISTQKLVFVHLGKTAGSSITCMLHPSIHHSGSGNSQCSNEQYHPSAISNYTVERVHLKPAPIDKYNNFLVTVRNPLDRIISWFYYLHPSYPPAKLPHHKRGCHNFAIFDCWDTIQSLSEEGLDPSYNHVVNNTKILQPNLPTSNHDHPNNKTVEECKLWALESIKGKRKCWHNYFNFNYTYGNLVKAVALSDNKTRNKDDGASEKMRKNIFVLRTEHLAKDWSTIDLMLGGNGTENITILHKNEWMDGNNLSGSERNVPNKTLSLRGRLNLCNALCEEIQIYKKILHAALNIDEESKNQSLDELIHSCPNESRDVIECQ